ncbi:hypothetical protein [Filimonas effusa]|uniref:Uncharacterized protein n=1 Tax=Filimonas effusa TaxID=2508721 RepID=A0A4Q1D6G8_9BACT|nr:hypothetical protein [Filimonas effusa]RXK83576.1 hypothetical protein ESB13_15925 [Filimonas effusa]
MRKNKWWTAKQEIAAFRAHIKNLPPTTPRAYTLSKASLDALMAQNGGLDGLRIYIGCKTVEDIMVPTITIVGTQLINGMHCDFGIPPFIGDPSDLSAARSGSVSIAAKNGGGEDEFPDDPGIGDPEPCPAMCGPDNALNSGD